MVKSTSTDSRTVLWQITWWARSALFFLFQNGRLPFSSQDQNFYIRFFQDSSGVRIGYHLGIASGISLWICRIPPILRSRILCKYLRFFQKIFKDCFSWSFKDYFRSSFGFPPLPPNNSSRKFLLGLWDSSRRPFSLEFILGLILTFRLIFLQEFL